MVRTGTSITFEVQGTAGGILRPEISDLRAQVINQLHAFFVVLSVETTIKSLLESVLSGELWNYDYNALVTIRTRVDYASIDDIRSVVAHAFYIAGGNLPTVTAREYGESQGAAVTETGFSLSAVPSLLLVGVVALVAIVAFSPTGRVLAGRL